MNQKDEITPTLDHLNDPYVIQLIETIARLEDIIEESMRENEWLGERIVDLEAEVSYREGAITERLMD
jgi:hypothetical protein